MEIGATMAFLTIGGFAIQRSVELMDPILERLASSEKGKGRLAGYLAFALGLLVASGSPTLLTVGPEGWGWLHILVSGLVLGSGAEGLNTADKYFAYVKKSRKAGVLATTG